jgi:drug/metabolite transporter (DMT)-like permease
MRHVEVTRTGIVLAVLSGAIASGLGYAIWYAALSSLKASHAANVQLSVPILAGIGGVVVLGEPVSGRLITASVLTLGGIWLVLAQRARQR